MALIKNLHLLDSFPEETLSKMEHAALQHHRYSNITFKIISKGNDGINIEIRQGKSPSENYFNAKRLVEITKETFGPLLADIKLKVGTQPYTPPVVDVVDPDWINKEMFQTGTKLKDIAKDTGIDYTNLSAMVNGKREISQVMKALFYFYFKAKSKGSNV